MTDNLRDLSGCADRTSGQSDLRDRIAKAIYLEANNWGGPNWETISPKVTSFDTEDKQAYCREAEIQERAFVADRLPQLGLDGIINPEKKFNIYVPDLIVDGLLSDLKSQFKPFFKVGMLYGIDPQWSVSFNLKDGRRYADKYPGIVVFFDVHWKTTTMTIRGRDYRVKPIHHTYAGYLSDVMKAIDECGNKKHIYQRRINDADGNALDSWLFDVRKLERLDKD